jgi:hypothetical protein
MPQNLSPILSAAASPAFLSRGCVNVVELDALKDSAGERWPRIRDGVYARLEMLLRNKLGPNDLFIRIGDTAYLITMPTTEAEDVSAICTRVAYDLHTSFLGECGLAQIHVDTVVGGEDDALILKRLPPTTVQGLAERMGFADLLAGSGPSKSHPGIHHASHPSHGQTVQGFPAPHDHSHHHLSHGHVVPNVDAKLEIEHQFQPVWSVPNAAVTTYGCEAKAVRIAGRPAVVSPVSLPPRERLVIEMSTLRHGITVLEHSHVLGKRFLLDLPLSFDTVGSPAGRMEMLGALRDLSHTYRSFITFVITGVPLGVGQTTLANMVTALSPFGRAVVATVHPATRAFTVYQGIGLKAIGYNLTEFPPRPAFSPEDSERLAQFARRNGLGTFLYGVRDKNTLKYAQDAGIQFLCGPAVAAPTDQPRGMWRLSWAEVLAKPETELWV